MGRQPGRQPGGGIGRAQPRAGQALDDHERGPGRVQVGLPAVEGQELQAGRHGDLLAVVGKRAMAQQRVHQAGGGLSSRGR